MESNYRKNSPAIHHKKLHLLEISGDMKLKNFVWFDLSARPFSSALPERLVRQTSDHTHY